MKIKTLTGSPVAGFSNFTNAGGGGTITGPLILVSDPLLPLQATTKGYIDNALNTIPSIKVVSGTMVVGRFPDLSGDVIMTGGDGNINLAPSGVGAGSYAKYSVDTKGRITGASALVDTDMPSMSWNKIVTGKTTSLNGYGIGDGVSKAGDTMTGFLTLVSPPTVAAHAANKTYVDGLVDASKYFTGDVYVRPMNVTPTGFLRANGGIVSKTTYSALYAVIGDIYTDSSSQLGSGHAWQQQYRMNATQSADIGGWTTDTALPLGVSQTQIVVTKSKVYLVGGYVNSTAGQNQIYSAPIAANGVLGAWVTEATPFPIAIHSHQIVTTKNRAYSLGGQIASAASNAIYTATIDSAGVMSAWTLVAGLTLPAGTYNHVAFTTRNKVYVIGGNATNKVYSCSINSDGTLGSWSTETNLPVTMSWCQYALTKNRVYLFAYSSNTVYTAPLDINGTIGTWVSSNVTLPVQLSATQVVVTNNTVYLLGGVVSGGFIPSVYYSTINADGTLAGFTQGTDLPGGIGFSQAMITSSRVYLIGQQGANIVYYGTFGGGLNDYSSYYNGTFAPSDPTNFKLPDFTAKETISQFYFIKY